MFKQKTLEETKAAQRRSTGQSSAASFYNNPSVRSLFYQVALIAGLLYFFGNIIGNTLANMEATGIKTGFDFLDSAAGYDVLMSLISFESQDTYLRVFVVGFLNTLLVSAIGIVFATMLGFLFGVMHF
ncbi:MAG: amino acid ABC transporter permease, partial [Litorivicinus sp.]